MSVNQKQIAQEDKEVSQIYKEYESGQAYLANRGLSKDIPKWVGMYEGKHWNPVTEETKDLPRPKFNIVRLTIDVKASKILSNTYKLNFIADNDRIATDEVSNFASYIEREINQKDLDRKAVYDGLKKGTFIYIYYWDKYAVGKKGNYEGGMRGIVVDPTRVVFADPTEKDVQKQKYIIWSTRQDVASVKAICKKSKRHLIKPDDLESVYNYYENDDSKLVTVYTKLFRIDGEVYYQNSTKDVVLHDPIPYNPNLIKENIKEKIKQLREENQEDIDGNKLEEIFSDGGVLSIPTKGKETSKKSSRYKFYYYPLIVGSFYDCENSIYGISEIEDIQDVQKSINTIPAFSILNQQMFASPKYVVKPDALKGQQITNKFGEVLIDYTKGTSGGKGIDIINPQPMTQGALELTGKLVELIRMVSNTTEIVTGDMVGKDLSGVTIGLLQTQNQKTYALQEQVFRKAQVERGKIWEQFFVLYYDDKEYSYDLSNEEITMLKNSGKFANEVEIPTKGKKVFKGSNYEHKDFNIVVEAGAGTEFSELQTISILNMLLQSKAIDTKTYIEMLPQNLVPFREKFKEYVATQEQSELTQLREKTAQQEQELQQLSAYAKEQENSIKELTANLEKANKNVGDLQKEYTANLLKVRDYLASMKQNQNPSTIK
jgi:hypothetical protein